MPSLNAAIFSLEFPLISSQVSQHNLSSCDHTLLQQSHSAVSARTSFCIRHRCGTSPHGGDMRPCGSCVARRRRSCGFHWSRCCCSCWAPRVSNRDANGNCEPRYAANENRYVESGRSSPPLETTRAARSRSSAVSTSIQGRSAVSTARASRPRSMSCP